MESKFSDDPLWPRVKAHDWPERPTRPAVEALLRESSPRFAGWLAVARQARQARDWPSALLAENHAARLAYLEDKPALARELALSALTLARELGDDWAEAPLYALLALLAWDDGRSKDGHDHALDAIASFAQQGDEPSTALVTRWYGEHLGVLGALPEARTALRDAERRFRYIGDLAAAEACAADVEALQARRA